MFPVVLKLQGTDAPDGWLDYMVRGALRGGFDVWAYPAEYAVSGEDVYHCHSDVCVLEKDMGRKTTANRLYRNDRAITRYIGWEP